jgi:hypothetical protein
MEYEATVLQKIQEFVDSNKMFTSVDIANAVKLEGLWVRNRHVRDWVISHFNDKEIFHDYVVSQIHVCGGSSLATLYHPGLSDPNDYLDRDQKPLTPDEVKQIQKDKKGSLKDNAADIKNILEKDESEEEDDEDIEMSVVLRSVERLKIPGAMIRKLGWIPGQNVDPALLLTSGYIPSNLKVNDDYRVSIPRSTVSWGTSPVRVVLKSGKIHFEKA